MKETEIAEYLKRIALDACTSDLAGLTKLQEHHMETIPFENLDIVVGRTIKLNFPHLFDKIILKKRGGYCFELNTLFAELLGALGFSIQPVLGRVWLSNPKNLPPRNHLAILVYLDDKTYISDVGFGGLVSSVPLDIDVSSPVRDKDGMLRVTKLDAQQFMIQRHDEKEWTNLYSFEKMEISQEDLEISNYYMSTHPNSHFCAHKFAGRSTKEGRIGLFNTKLSTRKGIKVMHSKRVDYGEDWLETLKNEFSIHLDYSEKELQLLAENNLENSLI